MEKPEALCDHPRMRCYGSNSRHRMLCACGCGKVVEVPDGLRLELARYETCGWFLAKHGPNRSSQPELKR